MKAQILLISILFIWVPTLYASESGELDVWLMAPNVKIMAPLLRRFETENPEIHLKVSSIPWNGNHEKFMMAGMSGVVPDLAQVGTSEVTVLHNLGVLENLDAFTASTASPLDKRIFLPASTAPVEFDNNWFGIPWFVDLRIFYYNEEMIRKLGYEKFPQTWDGLRDLLVKIRNYKRDVLKEEVRFPRVPTDFQTFLAFYWQTGGRIFPDGSTGPVFDHDALIETLRFFKELYDSGVYLQSVESGDENSSLLKQGVIPVFMSGTVLPEFSGTATSKWKTAMMTGHPKLSTFSGGSDFVLFKKSTHKEWAWRFLRFAMQPDVQTEWLTLSGNLPSNREAWTLPTLTSNPLTKAFADQSLHMDPVPTLPQWASMTDVIAKVMEGTIRGTIPLNDSPVWAESKMRAIVKTQDYDRGIWPWVVAVMVVLSAAGALFIFVTRQSRPSPKANKESLKSSGVLLTPAAALLFIFLLVPIVGSFLVSLTNLDVLVVHSFSDLRVIGLQNYFDVLRDSLFWQSLRNTICFAAIGVPLNVGLALAFAISLNDRRLRSFAKPIRLALFIPSLTTIVGIAIVFRWLYHPEFGVFNYVLTGFGLSAQNWLGNERFALPALILMAVWKGFGYNMIILFAGIQGVPESLYESAAIDGANEWQKHRYVTIPALRRVLTFVLITTGIGYFQFFAEPYVMTKGGPLNSTSSVVFYMYQHAFKFFHLGYASAIAYLLCLMTVAITSFRRVIFREREEL